MKEQANDPLRKVKSAFGFGHDGKVKKKRAPSKWILFVKKYAKENGLSYPQALKEAGPHYRNQ